MKPILFNTEMVQAILDGRKTVTRRVVKGYAQNHLEIDTDGSVIGVYHQEEGAVFDAVDFAPYRPGDILYVRETWTKYWGLYYHKAGLKIDENGRLDDEIIMANGERIPGTLAPTKWRPSIHMPREAARIFLRVVDVNVGQLQEIDFFDCINEGIPFNRHEVKIISDFSAAWDSTIKPADREKYGWDANPWVWIISFERCEKPEETEIRTEKRRKF